MKTLRHLSLLLILCCLFSTTRAQFVAIPDTAFVSWLQQYYPACMNGNQMDTTCPSIINAGIISITRKPVRDLTGMQYFDKLSSLSCTYDSIQYVPPLSSTCTGLNLNYNLLTAVPPLPGNIRSLQVSGNQISTLPALPSTLQLLECSKNPISAIPTLPSYLVSLECNYTPGYQYTGTA